LYQKMLHINASPHQIAMGFSVGTFIGIFPTFGLGWIIALALSRIFRFNYISAVLGSITVMNPVTWPFFLTLSAFVGAFIFQKEPSYILSIIQNGNLLDSIGKIIVVYITGNLIVSFIMSAICYIVVMEIIISYRVRKEQN
jgi:uncharacterized protein (DUF2062 family)